MVVHAGWRCGAVAMALVVQLDGAASQSSPAKWLPTARAKGIYGVDDRTDESAASVCAGEGCGGRPVPAAVKAVGGAATVALVSRTSLVYNATSNAWHPSGLTVASNLGVQLNLCDTDPVTNTTLRFSHQPVLSSCSGTVVTWNAATGEGLVATAGHCFDANPNLNGCQAPGHPANQLVAPPGSTCNMAGNGICEDTSLGGTSCLPGMDSTDCGPNSSSVVGTPMCDFLFVFDYTDQVANTAAGWSIPARNVYDCKEVVLCDVEDLTGAWLLNGTEAPAFTDYALVCWL